ncbi:HU family DNA-binding protein [Foetidibacter luteolus]|uniref:HU family DNA-binding protein n=1 Tax=Foetidibacter luteolus TaxID=2608880 RepID=UPI00129A40A3|nr:HU family DNA-binding protein [Foetidibacter luteolus]
MNKAELVAKLAEDAGLTKTQANTVLDSFTEAVAKSLKKGDSVTLVGFGTFSTSKRAARTGRNPQTGAAIKIAAKKVAKFKAGADLAKAVNK